MERVLEHLCKTLRIPALQTMVEQALVTLVQKVGLVITTRGNVALIKRKRMICILAGGAKT